MAIRTAKNLEDVLEQIGRPDLSAAIREALAQQRKPPKARKVKPPCAECSAPGIRLGKGGVWVCRTHYQKR